MNSTIKVFNYNTFAKDLINNQYTLEDIPKILNVSQMIDDKWIRACLDSKFGNITISNLIKELQEKTKKI